MNQEQQRKIWAAEIFNAAAEGKQIEYHGSGGQWFPNDPFKNPSDVCERPKVYRIKPEPVTRPWNKVSDIPGPVCYLRSTGYEEGWSMIIGARQDPVLNHGNGILLGGFRDEAVCVRWVELATHEYSTDRKTWHPCTVTEEAK
jgi:hypothetical protein